MNLLSKIGARHVLVVLAAAAILYAGYLFVTNHRENLQFCFTHAIACEISRLQTTASELERAQEVQIRLPDK